MPAQAFILEATIKAIEDVEAEIGSRKDRRRAQAQKSQTPSGLGLFRDRAPEPAPVVALAPSPVVVNVGQNAPTSDDIIGRLAQRVVDAPAGDRANRLRKAKRALEEFTGNRHEAEAMAKKLDDEIGRRGKTEGGSLLKKLTGLSADGWKGKILG